MLKISKEGTEITKRFFEAVDTLRTRKEIRGLQTITKRYGMNYWNMNTLRNAPDCHVLKPECLYYLVRDYGISAEWLLTGEGGMIKNTASCQFST